MKKVLPQILILVLIYFGMFFTTGKRNPIMLEASLMEGWLSLEQVPSNSEAARIIRDIQSDPTKMKWEYIKKRVFVEGNPEYSKLNDTVEVHCDKATYQDSLAISKTMREINQLVPNLFLRYEQVEKNDITKPTSFSLPNVYRQNSIYLQFLQPNKHLSKTAALTHPTKAIWLDGQSFMTHSDNHSGRLDINLINNAIFFYLEDELDKKLRDEYLRYSIFRTLCAIQKGTYPNEYYDEGTFSFYSNDSYIPTKSVLTDKDIFLLQKLYSADFQEEFEAYMYDTYPWRYATYFMNEDKAKVIAIVIICILVTLILILAFSLFYRTNFKYPVLNYISPILIFWTFYIELSWFYNYLTDMNYMQDYEGNIEIQLMATALSIVSGVILYFSERLTFVRKNFVFSLCFKVLVTFLVFISPIVIIALTKEGAWEASISTGFFISFIIPILILSLGRGVLIYLNHYSENLVKEKDLELSALREANTNSQLHLLQAQINPHFLYNSLNSIAGLAHKDADKTEQMALSLSDLFRYTVSQKNKERSTVSEEIEMVKRYLEIEQIRFGDRLDYVIKVDEGLESTELPRYIVQPLVENAIKHGVSKIEEKGLIELTVLSNKDEVILTVYDNGPKFPEGLLSGHGLQSVYDLLNLSYGEEATLNWTNIPQKKIEIRIPKNA